ncbi:hypothetical protein [Cryptosporangium sp. NPDC048952]|uniref:hypothetical protein n=1 Tax=Cryptosporangium sp. NPDC048952 TaxID=3363961 RepID=UPI0037156663
MNYRAEWRGQVYEAFPAPPSSEIRLYSDSAADGFERVHEERWRRIVPLAEVTRLTYVRVVASWRGEPFLVRAFDGGQASVEYLGGSAVVAARLGCERVERGVYRARVSAGELSDVHEDVVVIELGGPDPGSGARWE